MSHLCIKLRVIVNLCSVVLEVHMRVDSLCSKQSQSTKSLCVAEVCGCREGVAGQECRMTVGQTHEAKGPIGWRGGCQGVDIITRVLFLPLSVAILEPNLYLE